MSKDTQIREWMKSFAAGKGSQPGGSQSGGIQMSASQVDAVNKIVTCTCLLRNMSLKHKDLSKPEISPSYKVLGV